MVAALVHYRTVDGRLDTDCSETLRHLAQNLKLIIVAKHHLLPPS